jgi:ribosomal protein S27AE
VIVELAVERYQFTCRNCGHTWSADYDVQYLQDNTGDTWAFYRLDGAPVLAPPEDLHLCPVCGHGSVFVDLIARRDIPLASLDSDQPRTKVRP